MRPANGRESLIERKNLSCMNALHGKRKFPRAAMSW